MKKLFSSVFCIFSVLTFVPANSLISAYAETNQNVPQEIELSDEEFLLSDIILSDTLYLPDTPAILSNYNEGSYNYCDYLDKNNLAVYEAISALVTPSTDKITINFPEPVYILLDHDPRKNYTDEDNALLNTEIFRNIRTGIFSAVLDFPEIFWLDMANFPVQYSQPKVSLDFKTLKYKLTVSTVAFTPNFYESYSSLENVGEYKLLLEKAIEDFPVDEESSRYEQIKTIHDYICNFTYYDENADFCSSAVGSLIQPGVVCEGYSKGFKLICDRLNIPCVLVCGNTDLEKGEAHMWNYVQMDDGKWYAIDVTWDDLDGKNGLEIKYSYFLKGSESFNVNHSPENDYNGSSLVYPEISESDYTMPATSTSTTTQTTTTTTSTTSTTTTTTTTTAYSTTSKTSTTSTTSTTMTTSTNTTTTTTTSTTPTTTITSTTTTTTHSTTTTEPKTTTTTTTTPIIEPELVGDLNNDGKVNIADLVYCSNAVIYRQNQYSCDVNKDGFTDSFDIVFMRQLIIEKTSK